eukprot:CAMPEP_0180769258 /NCGR_PEP_ID=MMETSP1038_2-20121128/41003_1 /TAXON_ID=632150 /ORGANISM="Azadinium spinosum, Strain 3D9" /LENGTH=90 /DNA_ID=CAMNT_0022803965 /DNA_START=303 /DNA_END=575 /DNA_ORIENTATION=-
MSALTERRKLLLDFPKVPTEGAEDEAELSACSLQLTQEVQESWQQLHALTRKASSQSLLRTSHMLGQEERVLHFVENWPQAFPWLPGTGK